MGAGDPVNCGCIIIIPDPVCCAMTAGGGECGGGGVFLWLEESLEWLECFVKWEKAFAISGRSMLKL